MNKLGKKLKTFIKSKNEVRPYGLWMTEKAEVEVIDEFPSQNLELKHGHSTTGEESQPQRCHSERSEESHAFIEY